MLKTEENHMKNFLILLITLGSLTANATGYKLPKSIECIADGDQYYEVTIPLKLIFENQGKKKMTKLGIDKSNQTLFSNSTYSLTIEGYYNAITENSSPKYISTLLLGIEHKQSKSKSFSKFHAHNDDGMFQGIAGDAVDVSLSHSNKGSDFEIIIACKYLY